MADIRTYELFDIVWDRGSRWTGYPTEAEARAILDYARTRGTGSSGHIERRTWQVEVLPEYADLYRPGIGARQ